MSNTVSTRIQNKFDTAANWGSAGENHFIPLAGELIIYSDPDPRNSPVIKIGDGKTNVEVLDSIGNYNMAPQLDTTEDRTCTWVNNEIQLKWTNPQDKKLEDSSKLIWAGTRVLRKEGENQTFESITDGLLIADVQPNSEESRESEIFDPSVDITKGYTYALYPYTTTGTYTTNSPTVSIGAATSRYNKAEAPQIGATSFSYTGNPISVNLRYDAKAWTLTEDSVISATDVATYTITFQLNDTYYYVDDQGVVHPTEDEGGSYRQIVNWSITQSSANLRITTSAGIDATKLLCDYAEYTHKLNIITTPKGTPYDVFISNPAVVKVDKYDSYVIVTALRNGTADITFTVKDTTNIQGVTKTLQVSVENYAGNTLEETSWQAIGAIAKQGRAKEFWNIGDKKKVKLTPGIKFGHDDQTSDTNPGEIVQYVTDASDEYYVYIVDFDNNLEEEPEDVKGNIIFATFKTFNRDANGNDIANEYVDVCLTTHVEYGATNTEGLFMSPNRGQDGEWYNSYMRTKILGSTGSVDNVDEANPMDAAEDGNINVRKDTLMAALPSDLRSVMRRIPVYTTTSNVRVLDWLPLPSLANIKNEINSSIKQFDYYRINGVASAKKYRMTNAKGNKTYTDSSSGETKRYKLTQQSSWLRENKYVRGKGNFYYVLSANIDNLGTSTGDCNQSLGIAPIFKV